MTDLAAPVAGWRSHRQWAVVLGLVFVVQLVLQSSFFPLRALLDDTAILAIDAPFHQYQIEVAKDLCAQGRLTGYDPTFAAGHVGGVTFNASAKLPAALACLAGNHLSTAVIYKLVSFFSGLWAPMLIVWACWLLRMPPAAAGIAGALAVITWWTGAIRWYHTAGMVGYVAVAYATLPVAVALLRLCRRPAWPRVAALACFAALAFLVHPLFAVAGVMVALPVLVAGLGSRAALPRAAWVCAVVVASMLALNGAWLWTSFTQPSFATVGNPYQREVDALLVIHEMLGVARTAAGGSRFNAALFLGALLCAFCWKGPERRALLGFIAAAVVAMTWASVGAVVPQIAALQPNRFSALAWLCLIPPAAAGIWACAPWLRPAWRPGNRGVLKTWAVRAAWLLIALLFAFFTREVWREVHAPAGAPRYATAPPEARADGELSLQLVRLLKEKTNRDSRVFFENSLGRIHDGGHMAGRYARAADREFIGGPYPFTDFASAWDNRAFGRRLDTIKPTELTALLDAYNVGAMLCHSAGCRAAMSALPDASRVEDVGPVSFYRRSQPVGWAVSGRATVSARCINRLELTDVSAPSGQPLVLRYHWVPGLVSDPPSRIEAVSLVDGARPFIAIYEPPQRLMLQMGTGPGRACAP